MMIRDVMRSGLFHFLVDGGILPSWGVSQSKLYRSGDETCEKARGYGALGGMRPMSRGGSWETCGVSLGIDEMRWFDE